MRWTTVCPGCGMSLRLSEAQQGRPLHCPGCRQRIAAEPPRPAPGPALSRRPAPLRLRRWVVGACAGPVLVASLIGATQLNWSEEDGRATTTISPPLVTTTPRAGKSTNLRADVAPSTAAFDRGLDGFLDGHALHEAQLSGRGLSQVKSFALVGKVPASLAAAFDPTTGWLLAATRDGRLAWFDLPGCQLLGSCRLDRPAYHLAVDGKRRLLYAAATSGPLEFSPLGDRERGPADIHVYDLASLLKGKVASPTPLHRLPLDAHVTGLILSAGGDELYFAAEAQYDAQFGRLNTRSWKRDRNLWLRVGPPTWLALAPDRPVLHALAGGRLILLDARTWKVLDSLPVGGSVTAALPGRAGRVFLLERRHTGQVLVVDLNARKLLARWNLDADGRPYLGLSPGGDRLFVATSAVTTGKILGIDLTRDRFADPGYSGHAGSDRTRLLRGGLHVVGPEPYLLTGSGFVFRAGT